MNENYSIFAGVENLLDAYEERYNPTRPKFFYMGFNAKF
jgi:outer membrane receptor for ferrienterochelin and colicins